LGRPTYREPACLPQAGLPAAGRTLSPQSAPRFKPCAIPAVEQFPSSRPSGSYRLAARIEDQLQQSREAWMASHPSRAMSGTRAKAAIGSAQGA